MFKIKIVKLEKTQKTKPMEIKGLKKKNKLLFFLKFVYISF